MTVIGSATLELRGDALHFERTMKRASAQFKSVGRQMQSVGRSMRNKVTLPLLALGAGVVKASIDFESSFAGIRKTMDLTESEFRELARANRELARSIPVSVNELNKIGELAGQLGIRGVANVLKFEDTIAKLAVTTDLTAEQGALAFAQIANVMQLPQDQIDRLGAAVVDLGNNFATTESRIVEFTQRIGGAGKIAGLTVGDVAGIGTAFASMGIEAQAGGTAVQKVLISMLGAVQQGGAELSTFAATAGMSASEFAAAFRDDAAGAFAEFVEGLGRQGDAAIGTLEALGLQDQRLIRAILGAAGAGDLLRQAIERGNTAFRANAALSEEATKRFDTIKSRLTVLWNRIKDVAITLGDALMPILGDLVDVATPAVEKLAEMARGFAALPKPARQVIVGIAAFAAAIGPLLIALGGLVAIAPSVAAGLALMLGPIGAIPLAIGTATAVWIKFGDDFQKIGFIIQFAAFKAADAIHRALESLTSKIPILGKRVAAHGEEWRKLALQDLREAHARLSDTGEQVSDVTTRIEQQTTALGQNTAAVAGMKEEFGRLGAAMQAFQSGDFTALAGLTAPVERPKPPKIFTDEELEEMRRQADVAGRIRRAVVSAERDFFERRFRAPDFSDIGGRAFRGQTIAAELDLEKVEKLGAPNVNIPDLSGLSADQRQKFIDGVPLDELTGKLKSFGTQTKELLFGVGQDMVTGLIQGTLDMGDILKRFLIGFASRFILGPLFDALDIGSPSRKTVEMGRQIGAGFVVGMGRMEPAVKGAALSLAAVAVQPPSPTRTAASSTLGTSSLASRAREQAMPDIHVHGPFFDAYREAQSAGGQVFIREGNRTARQMGAR